MFSTQAKMCQEYVREIIFINIYKIYIYDTSNDVSNDVSNNTSNNTLNDVSNIINDALNSKLKLNNPMINSNRVS